MGCKDIGIIKSEFVAKTQFLCVSPTCGVKLKPEDLRDQKIVPVLLNKFDLLSSFSLQCELEWRAIHNNMNHSICAILADFYNLFEFKYFKLTEMFLTACWIHLVKDDKLHYLQDSWKRFYIFQNLSNKFNIFIYVI